MGAEGHLLKRIPRIKFPQRHPTSSASSGSASLAQHTPTNKDTYKSDVPAAPINTAVGGKATLQPKRTPVSNKEIEAILLGGCD
ncbi:hypothetical protein RGQ29_029881 [Quercus rubra]|uniref:Uncharacterized protein n=1 Tax=Quercus rubra TaxID=3512 RepID=A0AAN7EHE1_QUERU|nr:hypothetical protein RGQ29_029881 [Quercus rubra]